KVSSEAKDIERIYSFTYFTGSNASDDFVPPIYYHNKDIFGYFNGDYSYAHPSITSIYGNSTIIPFETKVKDLSFNQVMLLCFRIPDNLSTNILVTPKSNYAKNGLLKTIKNFNQELSYDYTARFGKFSNSTSDQHVGGVVVSKVIVKDLLNNTETTTNYKYTENLTGIEASTLEPQLQPDNAILSSSTYQKIDWYWAGLSCDFNFKWPGRQKTFTKTEMSSYNANASSLKSVTNFALSTIISASSHYLNAAISAAGAVAKGSAVGSAVGGAVGSAAGGTVVAGSTAAGGTVVGGTATSAAKIAAYKIPVAGIIILAITLILNIIAGCDNNFTEFRNRINVNADLSGINANIGVYRKVEVSKESGNGKIIYEFTNSNDYPYWGI
ncbi:MAG: hypothetical protein ACOVOV_05235, partial [Dolichospermum sp.]